MRNVELPKEKKELLFISKREINQQGISLGLSWFATELISFGAKHRASYSCPETSDGSNGAKLFSPYMFLEWKQSWIKKTLKYVNGVTNLIFCTLTPSSAPTNKPNAIPYIGQPNQNIIITNTFFNPITLDIEIAEHDFSTIAIALYGNQTKSMDDGIYTLYDTNNNIYKQYNLYEIRDQFNELLYEVRQDRGNNIDFSKNFTNIIT